MAETGVPTFFGGGENFERDRVASEHPGKLAPEKERALRREARRWTI